MMFLLPVIFLCIFCCSIEYWPDPQRGIREAYRVLKIGGKTCIIGPVYPTYWLSRFFADMFMLFPKEEEYIEWFTKAGFKDVQIKRIGPKWYRGVRRFGLIIGCSVTGVKPAAGDSPLQLGPKVKDAEKPVNPFVFLARLLIGSLAGVYYVLVPVYMWLKDKIFQLCFVVSERLLEF
ncbi:MPBQ/MSBQ methyltransferase 2 [Tanacetum coccineum]|uniref:MPBQ/MSBQ methyltransferase 2 n=1 Tax=Tanacetum coccineum TaxID=301880 RepID=A0ABQ4Y6W6_9ASTR